MQHVTIFPRFDTILQALQQKESDMLPGGDVCAVILMN